MEEDQKRLQSLTEEYQKIQNDISDNINARQKLESQQQESRNVQKEFASIDNDSTIYKLVGPVLLRQDQNEAVMAINGRLDFIEKEITRIEDLIKEARQGAEKKKLEVLKLQTTLQEQQGSTAAS